MKSSLTVRDRELRIEREMTSDGFPMLSSIGSGSRVRSETVALMCGWLPPFYSSGTADVRRRGNTYYKHLLGPGQPGDKQTRRQPFWPLVSVSACLRITRHSSLVTRAVL